MMRKHSFLFGATTHLHEIMIFIRLLSILIFAKVAHTDPDMPKTCALVTTQQEEEESRLLDPSFSSTCSVQLIDKYVLTVRALYDGKTSSLKVKDLYNWFKPLLRNIENPDPLNPLKVLEMLNGGSVLTPVNIRGSTYQYHMDIFLNGAAFRDEGANLDFFRKLAEGNSKKQKFEKAYANKFPRPILDTSVSYIANYRLRTMSKCSYFDCGKESTCFQSDFYAVCMSKCDLLLGGLKCPKPDERCYQKDYASPAACAKFPNVDITNTADIELALVSIFTVLVIANLAALKRCIRTRRISWEICNPGEDRRRFRNDRLQTLWDMLF